MLPLEEEKIVSWMDVCLRGIECPGRKETHADRVLLLLLLLGLTRLHNRYICPGLHILYYGLNPPPAILVATFCFGNFFRALKKVLFS